MRDTVPLLVFKSLERNDDPSDSPTIDPFRKNAIHSLVLFEKFCVLILLVAKVANCMWRQNNKFMLMFDLSVAEVAEVAGFLGIRGV